MRILTRSIDRAGSCQFLECVLLYSSGVSVCFVNVS
jgi:hypothetical protein